MSRRKFLKRIGLATLLPLVPAMAKAFEGAEVELPEPATVPDCGKGDGAVLGWSEVGNPYSWDTQIGRAHV